MRYEDEKVLKNVFSEIDVGNYIKKLDEEICCLENIKIEFKNLSVDRISYVEEELKSKEYAILGRTYKEGRNKCIIFIVRLKDGSQVIERYSFDKIADMRKKLAELKEKHNGADWSQFEDEI